MVAFDLTKPMHTRLFTVLLLACSTVLTTACAAGPPIVIDGDFEDWSAVRAAQSDPADAAPNAPVDFRGVRATADGQYVHLQVDFGHVVNVQKLPGSAYILFDVDGNASTGRSMYGLDGADLAVVLTAPDARDPQHSGAGIGVESATYTPSPDDAHRPSGLISPYDVGFTFGPTYASQVYEFRIERGVKLPETPRLFTADRLSVALVAFDQNRRFLDKTAPLQVDLPDLDTGNGAHDAIEAAPAEPLARASGTDLRLLSWNVEFSSLLRHPDNFIPILRAIKPDVVLLQELDQRTTSAQLTQFFNEHFGGDGSRPWNALVGAGGGNLHSGIATQLPMEIVEPLVSLPYRDRPEYTTRHASAVIHAGGRNVLATAIHLRCCGSMDSREEDIRLMEVDVVGEAIRRVVANRSFKIDAVLIAGDFNLVGSRAPLDNLARSLDIDGSALAIAQPLQLDRRSNATWADPDQPFVPGRLDYVLYSDATVHTARAFVFDARDLPDAAARRLGIDPDMTARASDHLPVIVDFSWNTQTRTQQ